jgi:uncharacterized repeat protein (TIGR01451 family)
VLLIALAAGRGAAASITPGGTALSNAAEATYGDAQGHVYTTESNTISTTVSEVGALVVGPKESAAKPATDSVPQGENAVRTFTIANSSNITDAYRITAATVSAGKLLSLAFVTPSGTVPVTIGTTVSPNVTAGSSITLQATISTAGLAIGQSLSISIAAQTTATGTANGLQSDSGESWIVIAAGPSLTGPGGATTKVAKTVNHRTSVQSNGGASVTFDILAQNSGGSAATNVVVSDAVPPGLAPNLASAEINGQPAGSAASLSGQTISVKVGTLAPGTSLDVSFAAAVQNEQTLGTTFVNTASISADGLPAITTTPASVLLGTADVVFDGYGGATMPISGAVVTLTDANGTPIDLAQPSSKTQSGATPQSGTQNPYVTGSDGTYTFALQPSQIAPGGSRFFLLIAAGGYLNRRIELDVKLDTQSLLYDVRATAVDQQPLAVAGGYALTSTAVQLQNVFGLFGNLPLFSTRSVTVSKTVDRQAAQAGDRLAYTVTFGNQSHAPLGAVKIADVMPPGLVYATGTARLDGVAAEPSISGNTLTWTRSALAPGENHTITYYAVVYPSVSANTSLDNVVTVTANVPATQANATASATATVQIVSGAFSDRSIITGRVFLDANGSGRFTRGDRGVPNVRIYLEDGTAVTTDDQGRYSFPSVRPGEHVLRLDATTLPPTVRARGELQQLVHGLFDDGLMQDVNFALGGSL